MSNIKHSVEELIGNTPLWELTNYEKKYNLKARILLKVESVNVLGSLKDRIAVAMLDALERDTDIKQGDTIIEFSSGNTAIALAAISRKRGYRFTAVVADMTEERVNLLKAYGADIVNITKPENADIAEIMTKATPEKQIHDLLRDYYREKGEKDGKRYFFLGQWSQQANRDVQYRTTGQEIIRDTDGKVDVFIGGIGSGGSISGISQALREVNPELEVIVFDSTPEEPDSIVGVHHVEGVPEFMLPVFVQNQHVYDRTVQVTKEQAYQASNNVAKAEGAFFGVSTGAAVHIATELAKKPEYEGKTIVAIAYDDVLKYLSTDIINPVYRED